MKKRVLFLCTGNSARSQMAEAFLNQLGGDRFAAESAGLEPGHLNPVVIEAMKEAGVDISRNKTKSVFDMFKSGRMFSHVITVCDESAAEKCPVFPGVAQRLHWSFPDPSSFQGTPGEKLTRTKEVRDQIKRKVEEFVTQC